MVCFCFEFVCSKWFDSDVNLCVLNGFIPLWICVFWMVLFHCEFVCSRLFDSAVNFMFCLVRFYFNFVLNSSLQWLNLFFLWVLLFRTWEKIVWCCLTSWVLCEFLLQCCGSTGSFVCTSCPTTRQHFFLISLLCWCDWIETILCCTLVLIKHLILTTSDAQFINKTHCYVLNAANIV